MWCSSMVGGSGHRAEPATLTPAMAWDSHHPRYVRETWTPLGGSPLPSCG